MNPLKKLAGQTLIYGLSSIVPRFLNYLLVPLYTYIFINPAEYGVITELYAYVVFLNIILTYGMETAYFKFCESEKNKPLIFNIAFKSIFTTTLFFLLITLIFSNSIATKLGYSQHANYIVWFAFIIAFDTLSAIPFVHLRFQNRPIRFSVLKISNVLVNICLNLILLLLLPRLIVGFKPNVGHVFLSNLVASSITLLMLLPEFKTINKLFNWHIFKKMLLYALPLLVAGLAGSINETLDRILLKNYIVNSNPMHALGIYGACLKVGVLMYLFVQTFRFAAEPFFFKNNSNANSKEVFADVNKYFIIVSLIICLAVVFNISIIKYFIGPPYWEGLIIVPIVLLSYLFLGIYFNLSMWYKLSGKTYYGAIITIFGAIISVVINILYIPKYGYIASAYAHLFCYIFMTLICYFLGQKYYPIKYNLSNIFFYSFIAIIFYILSKYLGILISSQVVNILVNNFLLLIFIFIVTLRDNKIKNFLYAGTRN